MFALALNQWIKQFENKIQSSVDSDQCWPIMDGKQCFISHWFKREKAESLFEKQEVERLFEAHMLMHDIANSLFNKYQQDNLEDARAGLAEMHQFSNEMISLLSDMN